MVTFWDYEKVGFDCEYVYATDDMHEDAAPRSYYVSHVELTNYIRDNGLADVQTDVDEVRKASEDEVWDFFMEQYTFVVEQYWTEVLEAELE